MYAPQPPQPLKNWERIKLGEHLPTQYFIRCKRAATARPRNRLASPIYIWLARFNEETPRTARIRFMDEISERAPRRRETELLRAVNNEQREPGVALSVPSVNPKDDLHRMRNLNICGPGSRLTQIVNWIADLFGKEKYFICYELVILTMIVNWIAKNGAKEKIIKVSYKNRECRYAKSKQVKISFTCISVLQGSRKAIWFPVRVRNSVWIFMLTSWLEEGTNIVRDAVKFHIADEIVPYEIAWMVPSRLAL